MRIIKKVWEKKKSRGTLSANKASIRIIKKVWEKKKNRGTLSAKKV